VFTERTEMLVREEVWVAVKSSAKHRSNCRKVPALNFEQRKYWFPLLITAG